MDRLEGQVSDETTSQTFVTVPFLAICTICFCTAISYSEFYLYPEHLRMGGMDNNSIGFIMGGFFVGAVIGVPLVDLLMHLVGGRLTVAFGLLCLVFAAFLLEKSRVIEIVFALRAVQGIGASAANVAGLVLATKVAPKRLAQAGALTGLSFVLGQGVAPFLAATLMARTQSFNAVYLSSAIVAALGLLCVPLLPAYAPNPVPPLPNRAVWGEASIPLTATAFLTIPFLAVISLIAAYASTIALGHAVSGFFLCFMAASITMRLGGGGLLDSLPRPQIIAIGNRGRFPGEVVALRAVA